MKSNREIHESIKSLEKELVGAKRWVTEVIKKYRADRERFGDADTGELDAARDLVTEITVRIRTLLWVLE
jgi:hypothetical protein